MCGIVGYIGKDEATRYLLRGLKRLEYRGYDSSGIVTVTDAGQLSLVKSTGRIAELEKRLDESPIVGQIGIGHTRWATHGAPNDRNSHPHVGGNGRLAIVHNGVIENHESLRKQLEQRGYCFTTETDSEVIAHQIDFHLQRFEIGDDPSADDYASLIEAVDGALSTLEGTFGLAIVFRDWSDMLMVARRGSPLIIGVGEKEYFVASDSSPLVGHTSEAITLADNELAVVTRDQLRLTHRDHGHVAPLVESLDQQAIDIDRGDYEHYMLKEIYEQPKAIRAAMAGRIDHDAATAKFGGLNLSTRELRDIRQIVITGCGTSWHASLVGEYQIETLARVPVDVQYASELRYRNPPMSDDTLLFAITQSGETADTLAALREVKRKGYPALAINNVVGSTIAREADGGIYLHAGPEIGVASTKAFTSQCTILALLSLYFGRLNDMSIEAGRRIIGQLEQLPDKVEEALQCNDRAREIAERLADCSSFFFLGRQFNFPTALEGALKLKEISYIHAEGYPAAEMKHGPIALIDEQTPSVFLLPPGHVYNKVLANIEEVKARGGPVVVIAGEGDEQAASAADMLIEIPRVEDFLQPIVCAIPLQLLAYHIAVLRGCDVDKPRNLAKSVTVE